MDKARSSRIVATPKKNAPRLLVRTEDRPGEAFRNWAQAFFLYLEKEKKATNPSLLELIGWLNPNGRREVALSIYNFLRPKLWKEFSKDRQRVGQQARKKLSKTMSDLRRAAATYKQLSTMVPELGIGTLLGADFPAWLPNYLESEATRLSAQREKCKVFSKKRSGTKENHAFLFRLQEFIDAFARRHADGLPASVARNLTAQSIADLLEAGKHASGCPANSTETNPENIDRALRRFRENKDNKLLCQILTDDARRA